MAPEKFKQDLLKVTLKSVDKSPNDWITFNDKLNARVIYDNLDFNNKIKLLPDELPIFECELNRSYLLITTERVISIVDDNFDEVFVKEIDRFSNRFEHQNYKLIDGKYPKIHTVAIKKKDGNELIYFIDSFYPSSFSKILIYNILSFKTRGHWYINAR